MRVDRRGFLKATALGAAALPVAAVEPDNRVVLDLEPTPENPRNSEGAYRFVAESGGSTVNAGGHFPLRWRRRRSCSG